MKKVLITIGKYKYLSRIDNTLVYDFSGLISGIDVIKFDISFSDYNNAGDVDILETIVDGAIPR